MSFRAGTLGNWQLLLFLSGNVCCGRSQLPLKKSCYLKPSGCEEAQLARGAAIWRDVHPDSDCVSSPHPAGRCVGEGPQVTPAPGPSGCNRVGVSVQEELS